MDPWNNWFHCTGSTYGTWLRGDPRGWRARHHREHVIGDYKSPPPKGTYDKLFEQSKQLMKRQRVILTRQQRELACRAMAEALRFHEVEIIDICIGAKHWHVLARFEPLGTFASRDEARRLMGIAKKRSARALSDEGEIPVGGAWAVRCRPLPVKNRPHQLNIAKYIRAHSEKGAAVLSLIEARDKRQNR